VVETRTAAGNIVSVPWRRLENASFGWPRLNCVLSLGDHPGAVKPSSNEGIGTMSKPIQLELFSDEDLRRCDKHELRRLQRVATTFGEGWRISELEERLGFRL